MSELKKILSLAAVAAVCVCGTAHAARVGVFIGAGPVFAPYPYYYPVVPAPYYYPPVVAVPDDEPPPEYVEQGQPQPEPQAPAAGAPQQGGSGSWYYCEASKTYYPYVKQCASGWREVPAQPQQ